MRKKITPDENHKPIKAFVCTKETQGQRDSDFCHAKEGELVHWSFECDSDNDDIDGSCGCRRSMSGIETCVATTTFRVAEVDLSEKEYVAMFVEYYSRDAILSGNEAKECAIELLETAVCFPLGYTLERRGDTIQTRVDF